MAKKGPSNSNRLQLATVLFQAAHEGLDSIGASVSAAIFPHLERNGAVGPGPTIENPEAFDKALRDIFGFGAELIEKKILEILCAKLQLSGKIECGSSFPEKVQNLERIFDSKGIQVSMLEMVKT